MTITALPNTTNPNRLVLVDHAYTSAVDLTVLAASAVARFTIVSARLITNQAIGFLYLKIGSTTLDEGAVGVAADPCFYEYKQKPYQGAVSQAVAINIVGASGLVSGVIEIVSEKVF